MHNFSLPVVASKHKKYYHQHNHYNAQSAIEILHHNNHSGSTAQKALLSLLVYDTQLLLGRASKNSIVSISLPMH